MTGAGSSASRAASHAGSGGENREHAAATAPASTQAMISIAQKRVVYRSFAQTTEG